MVMGMGPRTDNRPTEIRLSGHGTDTDVGITLDSTARDPGNVPTTTLRKGLVVSELTPGVFTNYPDDTTEATPAAGILLDEVDLLDADGDPADSQGLMMVHGVADKHKLFGLTGDAEADMSHIIFRVWTPSPD